MNIVVDARDDKRETLVSVIMPVYNVAKYLDECMTGIVNQTLKNIEIICVDDGSTDNSLEILKKYAENDDRIIIATQKNQYAGVARNNGFKLARGKYVIFLDPDDFFELNMLELSYERLEFTGAEICIFRGFVFDSNSREKVYLSPVCDEEVIPNNNIVSPRELGNYLFEAVDVFVWNKLYLKSFIDRIEIKFQKIRSSDEVSFVYTSVALAEKLTFIQLPLIYHRIGRGDSSQDLSHEYDPLVSFEAFRHLKENLLKCNIYDNFKICFVNKICANVSIAMTKFYGTEHFEHLHKFIKNSVVSEFDLDILNINNITQTNGFEALYYMISLEVGEFHKFIKINIPE